MPQPERRMPDCLLCGVEVENTNHPAAPAVPGGNVEWACEACYARLMEMVSYRPTKMPPCEGCGSAPGAGCSCKANARAIGRGEAAKCRAEEPWSN